MYVFQRTKNSQPIELDRLFLLAQQFLLGLVQVRKKTSKISRATKCSSRYIL